MKVEDERDSYAVEDVPDDVPGRWAPVIAMWVFIVGAFVLLYAGFRVDNAITSTALFAAAAVVGILARMIQAGWHHDELLWELRRRNG